MTFSSQREKMRDLKQRIRDAFFVREYDERNRENEGEPMMICTYCGRLRLRCYVECDVCGFEDEDLEGVCR